MSILLNVTIPSQGSSTNLCWAAVTIGVCASLGDPRRSLGSVTSKYIATCQGDLSADSCDRTYDLQKAIVGYGHNAVPVRGQLSLKDLQQQIDNLQRPVPVIISYPFTNHACLINGWIMVNGTPHIVLLNPSDAIPTDKYYNLAALCDGSAMGAQWIDSYLVS